MTDRTVSITLQARVTDYLAKMSAAGRATTDLANKVELAKGRTAQGFHTLGIAGVAMGSVVAGGYALAIKASADFEAKMALVRTLSHATSGEMTQLSGAALHVGQAYGYTASQVADAEAELVKAGVSVSDIMGGALTGALTLASAGQTDVATATTIAATAMTQFALKGKDVPHIADLLAAGADKALGSVVDLGYALDQAGPTAHQFGVSIEETIGTLAAFAQSGQIGERGGTILTQMLLKLTAPGKQASTILNDLGISIYGANGQFVGMANLAGQLHDKLGKLTQAERNHDLAVVFGSRAIRGANILYQEGAKGIADWTNKVNTQGFAALQASGKLDSLSGDVTKLKAALQTAFIGVGSGSQGPLRGMVEDITHAVLVWNGLPGPVRVSAEALTLVAGAAALAGGAALLAIPKWAAMNAALEASGRSAITVGGSLRAVAAGGAIAAGIVGVYEGVHALNGALHGSTPSVRQYAAALADLGQNATGTGRDLLVFLTQVAAHDNGLGLLSAATSNLDLALAGLVTGGHADQAAADWTQMNVVLHRAGMSTAAITKLFPQYAGALSDSATSAKEAGNGIDQFGNKVGAAAKKTKSATDAAKKYSDALHALADPLFAMNQALQGVTDAQHAANVAVRKYGAASPQARQANLDLASSALDAEAAARTLAASVKDGSVSIGAARKYLRSWVADGLLTKQQADDVSASFDHLIGRAQTISGLHPHMTVTADTSQAETALGSLIGQVGQTISDFLTLGRTAASVTSGTNPSSHLSGPGSNPSAAQPGGRSSGGRSGGATTGYVPTTSDSSYYTPSSTGGSSGSGSGSGAGTKTRPPTVQEIVHAILTGTIPPSIDKLSKVLQHEIGHLSSVVANAEQYRSTIRSGLTGYAGLSNMGTDTAGTDLLGASGPPGKVNVNAYLRDRGLKLKQFAHLLNRLDREGLSPDLLSQIAQIGPDAIPAMQELLSTGHRGIRRADHLEARIRRYAGQATTTAVNDRYATALIRSVDRLPNRLQHAVTQGLRHAHFQVSFSDGDRKGGHRVRTGT